MRVSDRGFIGHLRRGFAGLAAVAIAGSASGSLAAGNESETIVAELGDLVFGSEFKGQETSGVHKWVGPLRLAVYGGPREFYLGDVEAHLAEIAALTGIDASLVAPTDPSRNAHILFLARGEYEAQLRQRLGGAKNAANRRPVCFGMFGVGPRGEITSFLVLIPDDLAAPLVHACIVEETTQVLGLKNDLSGGVPSIFNDDGKYVELSERDRVYLRVLYDPRITPGMSRSDFTRTAQIILDRRSPEGAAPAGGLEQIGRAHV